MLTLWFTELVIVISLGLESSFYCFYVVLTVCYRTAVAVVDWDVFGVYFGTWNGVHWGFVLEELGEVRDKFLEGNLAYAFGFKGRYS